MSEKNNNEEKETISFEQAMDELEKIVRQLEEGDVPLEKAIELYKKGMELSAICNKKLKAVEKEMTTIMDEHNALHEFEMEEQLGEK